MAYQDNNKEVIVASLQKNSRGDYILIKQVENTKTGAVAVDVREYYTNDDDELTPTRKGIRIKDEQAAEVMTAMFKACTAEAQMDILDALNEYADGTEEDIEEE